MPVTVEFRALHRAIDDLRTAVISLRETHGRVPAVARLENDLDRLILDVADADALPAARPVAAAAGPPPPAATDAATANTAGGERDNVVGEQYSDSSWEDDIDDEGVGGFRGHRAAARRPGQDRR